MIRDFLSAAANKVVEVVILDAPRKGDLLNGPERVCECGDCRCPSPLEDPNARPGREFHD